MLHAIEVARREQRMTYATLGQSIGVSRTQVARMLDGERPCSFTEIATMCAALGLDPAVVIERAARQRPKKVLSGEGGTVRSARSRADRRDMTNQREGASGEP